MSLEYTWTPKTHIKPSDSTVKIYDIYHKVITEIQSPNFINGGKSVVLTVPYEGAFYFKISDTKQSSEFLQLVNVNDPSNDPVMGYFPPNTDPTDNSVLEFRLDAIETWQYYIDNSRLANMTINLNAVNSVLPSYDPKTSSQWVTTEQSNISSWQGKTTVNFSGLGSAWINKYPDETLADDAPHGIAIKNLKAGDVYLFSGEYSSSPERDYPDTVGPIINGMIVVSQGGNSPSETVTMSNSWNGFTYLYTVPEHMDGASLSYGIELVSTGDIDGSDHFRQANIDNFNIRNVKDLTNMQNKLDDLAARIVALENP